jgi:hypothetical protein
VCKFVKGALLLSLPTFQKNGHKFLSDLQHISIHIFTVESLNLALNILFMSEDQLVCKRLKLDINNTYINTRMNFLLGQSSQKPFAETIAEFLERPLNFRPKPEHINMTLPDVRFKLSS